MKLKITIHENLDDITLEQYKKFLKLFEINDDTHFIHKKMVQIFCGVPLINVEHMDKGDFDEIVRQLAKVLDETPEFTDRFFHNGVEYGFIPNLDKISLAEFVDLDNLTGNVDELEQLMSILYRPIRKIKGNKYRIEPYKGKKFEDFKDIPASIVIASQLFFWHLGNELLNHTNLTLQKALQTKEIRQKLPRISEKHGAGTPQLQNSLDMTIQKLRESLNQSFIPAYII
ncbi:hypothetical protein [Costertonia aggregata]|uniref:Uncharacterized protein n=1 Tax=Costertonia aggregata TaxID=343403 RepID=A0A7H9ARK0_9FLAO|nr:hypothetical protein [Costertonia aggregata]QLG46046.1 hypothetical protein HYG79_12055 [Costertonia aggregata]